MAAKTTEKKKAKSPPLQWRSIRRSDYLLREGDVERIDGLISALGLAISQILACREIRERSREEMPAVEDFDSQIDLVLQEAERQLHFPWSYSSDF